MDPYAAIMRSRSLSRLEGKALHYSLSRLVVYPLGMSGFRVAAFILAVIIQRFMLHLAVILDRAKRRSGLLKPFARGPDGIAARRALAFEHPRSEGSRVGEECVGSGSSRWSQYT